MELQHFHSHGINCFLSPFFDSFTHIVRGKNHILEKTESATTTTFRGVTKIVRGYLLNRSIKLLSWLLLKVMGFIIRRLFSFLLFVLDEIIRFIISDNWNRNVLRIVSWILLNWI